MFNFESKNMILENYTPMKIKSITKGIRITFLFVYFLFQIETSYGQASVVAGSITTTKTNYAVGNGNNRLIVVAVSQERTPLGTISGITWGGQSLTLARAQTGGTSLQGEIWYLDEAGISAARGFCSYNFVVTWTAGPTNEAFTAFTLKDVDQTNPVAAVNSATTSSGSSQAPGSISAGVDDIVVYASASNASRTHTPAGTYTELSDQVIGGTTSLATASKQITIAASENPAAAWVGGNSLLVTIGVAFNGVAATSTNTFYSLATGAWDVNTSWSFSADGSTGAVPVGVWPRRTDNVVIRTGHTITVNATDDNKSCSIRPDELLRSNVGPFTGSNTLMFYQIGDILINGTLFVGPGIEMMTEGFIKILSGGSFTLQSAYVNLGSLEADIGSTIISFDDLILTGNSATTINTTSISNDDLIISFPNATLCGTGTQTLQNGGGSVVTYVNGATVAQICTSFTVACAGIGCGTDFPVVGTTDVILGNTGPGGVGNSSNNILWLRANDLNLTNGAPVTSWPDFSGNGLTATNGNAASQPTFSTNSVNSIFPSISFIGDNVVTTNSDWLSLGTPASLNLIPQTNSWSFFSAFNVATNNSGTLLSKATGTVGAQNYQYTVDNSNPNRFGGFMGGNFAFGTQTATGAWTLGTGLTRANATGYDTFVNETFDLVSSTIGTGTAPTTDILVGGRRIDASTTTSGFGLTGNIAEIAMYNTLVNTSQRIIINNYLSAKYNTTLAANDVYDADNSGNGNFDFEVAGIGQAIDGTNHRDGKGSGIVRVWNPNGLDNGEFLLWGHNNATLVSSTTTVGLSGVDGTIIKERLVRIWRVNEYGGDVGTVSISFDIGSFFNPLGSNLRLLIDRDGDGFGDNDVTPIVGSNIGSTIIFSGVNFQNGDRFTLGNTDNSLPLPIELLSFTASSKNGTVELRWSTSSELNNDYFTIERSNGGEKFEEVLKVKGMGTKATETSYFSRDTAPFKGISYYRLKQTDFDGRFSYSNVVSVSIDGTDLWSVFPNPADANQFNLQLGKEEIGKPTLVELRNSAGQLVFSFQSIADEEGRVAVKPTQHLLPGFYITSVTVGPQTKRLKLVVK